MKTKPSILGVATLLALSVMVAITTGVRGKDDPRDKKPADEQKSLVEKLALISHPLGRILDARVNPPNRSLNLWNVEAVAAVGITGDANGEIDREYELKLETSATDASGKALLGAFACTTYKQKNKSFASVMGISGTLSERPASGKLVVTIKLTATDANGKVIELDEFKTTADIP